MSEIDLQGANKARGAFGGGGTTDTTATATQTFDPLGASILYAFSPPSEINFMGSYGSSPSASDLWIPPVAGIISFFQLVVYEIIFKY